MLGWGFLIALGSAFSSNAANPGVIELDERRPILMVALTPGGQQSNLRAADLYRAADDRLRAETTLFVRTPEQAGVDLAQFTACPLETRLTCWVSLARPIAPLYLLVVSMHPQSGTRADKLTSLMIDVAWALRELDQIPVDEEGWQMRLEDRIFERATHAKPIVVEAGAVAAYFESLFGRELAPALEASRSTESFGAIVISGAPAGMAIELDGRTIGSTSAARTELRGVTPRLRKLVLSDPTGRHAVFTKELLIESGRTAEVAAEMTVLDAADSTSLTARRATIWGGAGVAAIGAAIAVYAIAAAPSARTVDPCFGADCAAIGPSKTFATFCELGADDPASCSAGVLAAPLGYSVAIAGGLTALGSMFFATDDGVPWLPIVAGVLAGGATYAISAAAE